MPSACRVTFSGTASAYGWNAAAGRPIGRQTGSSTQPIDEGRRRIFSESSVMSFVLSGRRGKHTWPNTFVTMPMKHRPCLHVDARTALSGRARCKSYGRARPHSCTENLNLKTCTLTQRACVNLVSGQHPSGRCARLHTRSNGRN